VRILLVAPLLFALLAAGPAAAQTTSAEPEQAACFYADPATGELCADHPEHPQSEETAIVCVLGETATAAKQTAAKKS
jgi:hypothetical protein